MLRTTILSIAACLALATHAFAANTTINLEQSFMVAGDHKSSDSKSKDDSSSDDSKSGDSSSEDDKSHDS